jgi:putative ABC transport system permease protein
MWALGLLRRRPGRVLLTVLGIALAVGLTTTMLSISAGLDQTSRQVLADTGVDLLVLDEGSPVVSTSHLPFTNGTRIADALADLTGVKTSFPIFERTVTLFPQNFSDCRPACPAVNPIANGENPARRDQLGGIDMDTGVYFETAGDPFAADPAFVEHRYPDGFNSSWFTREIVLNRAVARELNAALHGTVFVSATREFEQAQAFRVVGIYEASFETDQTREVRVHLSELQYMARATHDEVTLIALDLDSPSLKESVKAAVEARYPTLRAATPEDILGELDRTTGAFEVFAGLIAFVSIGVAILFAATIFMISARERVGEIAALRAIGISRSTILREMLMESGIVGAMGLAVGVAIGVAGAWAIDFVLKTTTSRVPHGMDVAAVTPEVVLVVGFTSVLIAMAAGLVPAIWATRVSIAAAIRNL